MRSEDISGNHAEFALCTNPCYQRIFGWRGEDLLIVDASLKVVQVSTSCQTETGLNLGQGHPCQKVGLEATLECCLSGADCPIQTVLATGQLRCTHHVEKSPDKKNRYYEVRYVPLRDIYGKVTQVAISGRDVSAGHWAEEQRAEWEHELQQRIAADRENMLHREQNARAEAENAMRTRDEFLAMISHELRTPLTPIVAATELLSGRPDLPEDVQQLIHSVRENALVESRLVSDLLDVTALNDKSLQLQLEQVDIHEVLRRAIESQAPQWRRRSQTLRTEFAAQAFGVIADPNRLLQVFWNLLSNAAKFTLEHGTVTVQTSNCRGPERVEGKHETAATEKDGGTENTREDMRPKGIAPSGHTQEDNTPEGIAITVSDTGIGMSPQTLARIFRPFEQGDSSITRPFGGMGLGLTAARYLVETHNGHLVASSPGEGLGSTFVVWLPVALAGQPPVQAATTDLGKLPLQVVIVEDNADTACLLSRVLETLGCQVRTAGTARAGVDLVRQKRPDLLLSDIGLPDCSGWEMMREIRAMGPLPAIAMSGFGQPEDIRRSYEAGFKAHLIKPVTVQQLRSALKQTVLTGG